MSFRALIKLSVGICTIIGWILWLCSYKQDIKYHRGVLNGSVTVVTEQTHTHTHTMFVRLLPTR